MLVTVSDGLVSVNEVMVDSWLDPRTLSSIQKGWIPHDFAAQGTWGYPCHMMSHVIQAQVLVLNISLG